VSPSHPRSLPHAPSRTPPRHLAALRRGRAAIPRAGSICAALDVADPAGQLSAAAFGEALAALKVGALVFGIEQPAAIGAQDPDAAYVFDLAIYHLTGSPADTRAALEAFRRAAGPPLPVPRTA
jgi:hypothetical protein